ncbi:restriction endonuclease subunit S [Helicobacter pylori]
MSEWQTFYLKDLVKIVGGATPPTNNPKNYGNKIRWITAKDLSTLQGRYIKKGSRSISRLGFKSCSTFLLPKHAILFSVRATIGYTAIISKRSCTDRGLMGLVPNKKIYFEFLYYLLKYHKDNISNMGVGTTLKGISKPALGLFKVKIPPTYYEQQKIARTLSILDQKIENNHKINELLHKILELLYEQYFVRFDFLDENNKPYQTSGGKMKFSKELNRLIQNRDYSSNDYITYIPISKNNKICYQYDIMIDKCGEAGAVRFGLQGAYNSALSKISVLNQSMQEYIRSYLNSKPIKKYLSNACMASTRSSLNKNHIYSLMLPIPPINLLQKYEKIAKNIITAIIKNNQSTQTLTVLRDFLLPLLLKQQVKPK